MSLAEGSRDYDAGDYKPALSKWTRKTELLSVDEMDNVLSVTSTFESWDFRWAYAERYARDYWGRIPGVYFTGDAAAMDEDGYFWFSGRADEIIKIAAHRLGTIEVESAFLTHPAVAECGVVGRPDEIRGEVIAAFVLLKHGQTASSALQQELVDRVRHELGPVAVIGDLRFVNMLPKTRSGKIMRRVLKAVTLDRDPGDITTIEDEGSVEEARDAWRALRARSD